MQYGLVYQFVMLGLALLPYTDHGNVLSAKSILPQAKLRKMVDEQVSVGARVEAEPEPEPADPLITPAISALERSDLDPRPVPPERRLLIGTLDKPRNGSLNGDKEATLNRTTRLSIRNGKDNPFIGECCST